MDQACEYDSKVFDAMTRKQWDKIHRRHPHKTVEYFLQINEEEKEEKNQELMKYILNPMKSRYNVKDKPEINVVMLGKTGHGKSATANTMVDQGYFEESGRAASCTKKIAVCRVRYKGQMYKIIDTPGLFDTVTNQEDIKQELSKVIDECITGVDAFVYVHNGTVRFSPEEQNTIKELERVFGDRMTYYSFLVTTRADTFLMDTDMRSFVNDSKEVTDLHMFIEKLGRRVVAVNNKAETEFEKEYMRDILFNMVSLVREQTRSRSYTNELFEEARKKQMRAQENKRRKEEAERRRRQEEVQVAIATAERFFRQKIEDYCKSNSFSELRAMKEDNFRVIIRKMMRELTRSHTAETSRIQDLVPDVRELVEKMSHVVFNDREMNERERIQREERRKTEAEMERREAELRKQERENRRMREETESLRNNLEETDLEMFRSSPQEFSFLQHVLFRRLVVDPSADIDNPLHPNIFCDICGCPIRGVRFKCAVCRDYDLCEDCDDDETHTEHPMIKIHIPEPRWRAFFPPAAVGERFEDAPRIQGKSHHRGVECDQCGEVNIYGVRFKCVDCDDYDLCEDCDVRDYHGRHPMVRIRHPRQWKMVNYLFP